MSAPNLQNSVSTPALWPTDPSNVRHVLSLSGGKDSAALAVYLRDRVPKMEYIFHDTGKELPDTYDYLDRLEGYLGTRIVRTNFGTTFDHLLRQRVACYHRIIVAGARN